jgi:hypothetical protein
MLSLLFLTTVDDRRKRRLLVLFFSLSFFSMIAEEEEGQRRPTGTHRCILSLFHFRSWFVRHFFCSLRERNDDDGNDARDGGEQ